MKFLETIHLFYIFNNFITIPIDYKFTKNHFF